jgi:hypothetical protein
MGLNALPYLAATWVACVLYLLLSGCSSNPKDDPNIVDCGNGYYARTKERCP